MRGRILLLTAIAGAVAATGANAAMDGPARAPSPPTRLHVIEHAVTDVVTDTGARGDSAGDLLTFHNAVFDAGDTHRVGRDIGDCIRVVTGPAGAWECRWTTILRRGAITVEGPFFDTHPSTLAVTGGTGRFRAARGEMRLRPRDGGAAFDFVFLLQR